MSKLNLVLLMTIVLFSSMVLRSETICDHYISTGDNHFLTTWLPVEDANGINASFDLLKDVWNVRRIYWRGLQESQSKRSEVLADVGFEGVHPRIQGFKDFSGYLINEMNIEKIAVAAAHERGIELWGFGNLYDWGGMPDTPLNSYYGYPYTYQAKFLAENPQWMPVDKYGVFRQTGPFEMAYPQARATVINAYVDLILDAGYDGVSFLTYAENFGMRFQEQFGYSEPIVEEFYNRYGVDIRKEAFNRQDWISLRGEYTTLFLQELKAALSPYGVEVSMPLYSKNPARTRDWPWDSEVRTAGDIEMDYMSWIDNGSVDILYIEGSNISAALDLVEQTEGSGVEIAMMTSSPNLFLDRGLPLIYMGGDETGYLTRSTIAAQPLSALSDSDPYIRMRVLAQIIEGTTSATFNDLLPLASDSHLLVRKMAMRAIGLSNSSSALPVLEAGIFDNESGVRNGAIRGLQTLTGVDLSINTAELIIDAIEAKGNFMFNDAAAFVLAKCKPITSLRTLLVNELLYNSNPMVRETVAHTLTRFVYHSDIASVLIDIMNNDESDRVRQYAAQGLGKISGSVSVVMALVNATALDNVSVSQRAAQALGEKYCDSAAIARKSVVLNALSSLYKKLADPDCLRSVVQWGYRPVGDALLAYGAEGEAILQGFYSQSYSPRLAQMAWLSLYMPQINGDFTPMTEQEYDSVFEMKPLIFDFNDIEPMASEWLVQSFPECSIMLNFDLNNDCYVDLCDFSIMTDYWVAEKWPY